MTEIIHMGFKVVFQRKDGKLVSYNENNLKSNDCVRYVPNEWTIPKKGCGPLVLFENEDDARGLKDGSIFRFALKLFEFKYIPSKEDKVWYAEKDTIGEASLERIQAVARGSVLAKKIKILEEVK